MRMLLILSATLSLFGNALGAEELDLSCTVQQLTFGPQHHFYGYIGHVGNTPWNGDGRYMLLLRSPFQDHLPGPQEAADIVLVDTMNGNAIEKVEESRAWNLQQGTMLYWNPEAPKTQFFFNDRDPQSNRIFCVLYDVAQRRRIKEYRYEDASIGNSGVAQQGGFFLGLNYGRLARLRPVTGYPEAADWTKGTPAPKDDGIFKITIATGEKTLLVSYAALSAALGPQYARTPLFINHSLCNRENTALYFFVRGGWGGASKGAGIHRVNSPFSVDVDGGHLAQHHQHIGGHPEWAPGGRLIGRERRRQVYYDVARQEVTGTIASPEIIPDPEGDIALSPDARLLINGHRQRDPEHKNSSNHYVLIDLESGAYKRLPSTKIGPWDKGDLRIDPAPCWRRDGKAFAVPALAKDGTRQTFVYTLASSTRPGP